MAPAQLALSSPPLSACQAIYTLNWFLVSSWYSLTESLRVLARQTPESGSVCERLVVDIVMCVLWVMFYLGCQCCMSSPGVLTDWAEVISNNI